MTLTRAAITVTTVLRLADDTTVPIVLREARDGSSELIAMSIAGMLPEHWQAGTLRRLAGTPRETAEQKQHRDARRVKRNRSGAICQHEG